MRDLHAKKSTKLPTNIMILKHIEQQFASSVVYFVSLHKVTVRHNFTEQRYLHGKLLVD